MSSRTLFSLAILLVALAAVARAADQMEAVEPVILPAPQTSVTSTQFNPNIQNAGGTTNAAGTFNVVSLARSSSYAGGGQIQQTTSYVINSPNFAPQPSLETPAYFTETASSSVSSTPAPNPLGSSVSLVSGSQSIIASSSTPNAAFALQMSSRSYNSLAAYMVAMAGVVVAAVAIL